MTIQPKPGQRSDAFVSTYYVRILQANTFSRDRQQSKLVSRRGETGGAMHQPIPVLVKLILTKSGVDNGFLEKSVAKSVLGHTA